MSGTLNHTGCFIYAGVKRVNNGSFLGIVGFEGIPQNFVLNLMLWLLFHILFIILRKKAWNYGRMAVIQKDEIKWADMFYGDEQDGSMGSFGSSHGRALIVASNTSEHVNRHSGDTGAYEFDELGSMHSMNNNRKSMESDDEKRDSFSGGSARIQNSNEIKDKGYFRWIKIVFNLTDKQYRDKCGPDCVFYLSFQRHLIFLAIIVTFFSLAVILPINVHRTVMGEVMVGNNTVKRVGFSDTTIINLGSKYEFLWFHIALSMIFLLISVVVMRHFSKKLKLEFEDDSDHHTVSIIGINKNKCDEDLLRAHLAETYPGTEITEISFAYDISKLQVLEFQRLSSTSARIYFQEVYEKKKEFDSTRPRMRPHTCGNNRCCWCCWRCCCKDTDAIDYYTQREAEFTKQVLEERSLALQKPVGIVYVTFKNLESAENIVEDYACSARLFLNAPVSKFTKELHSNQWIVKYAPEPEDIYWENLSIDYKVWYAKFVVVNIIVLIIAIIFSTPVSLFQSITFLPTQKADTPTSASQAGGLKLYVLTGIILDTLPTLILWVMSIALIALVGRSDIIIGFWTKTAGNLSEMTKTFIFLILMIVILPSLGITSIRYFFDKEKNIAWSCIFYKDNGAFFVNYICTSSLAGTAAELMRLPELFMYAYKLMMAKSQAETAAIRKSLLWDFQIGVSYAWTMLHFAMFICFSIIYPLVTPFGLLYLLLKHFTDRYNIYFAYAPCKVDREVHTTAVNFVIMSMFMLQLNLLAYVHFHIGDNQYHDSNLGAATDSKIRALQICSLLEFSITAAFFLGQCCFNICADLSPFSNRKSQDEGHLDEENEDADAESTFHDGERVSRRSRASRASRSSKFGDAKFGMDGDRRRSTRSSIAPSEMTTTIGEEDTVPDRVRPYKRYTPIILRPELVRLALEASASATEENVPPENVDVQVQTVPFPVEPPKSVKPEPALVPMHLVNLVEQPKPKGSKTEVVSEKEVVKKPRRKTRKKKSKSKHKQNHPDQT